MAGAITKSPISLSPIIPEHLTPVIAKLAEAGTKVEMDGHSRVRLVPGEKLLPIEIETRPHPGFPTDMQAQFMALTTLAEGNSVITETVFENRLQHVAEFNRMGANIRQTGNSTVIRGVPFLSGAPVTGTDLRAAAA